MSNFGAKGCGSFTGWIRVMKPFIKSKIESWSRKWNSTTWKYVVSNHCQVWLPFSIILERMTKKERNVRLRLSAQRCAATFSIMAFLLMTFLLSTFDLVASCCYNIWSNNFVSNGPLANDLYCYNIWYSNICSNDSCSCNILVNNLCSNTFYSDIANSHKILS